MYSALNAFYKTRGYILASLFFSNLHVGMQKMRDLNSVVQFAKCILKATMFIARSNHDYSLNKKAFKTLNLNTHLSLGTKIYPNRHNASSIQTF